ncbi:TetR/AcrR family transcriptional regulator [Nocardia sp. NPDC050710]|uniref:TetR/AcrR family transcriptional regulator n=1 Tax=Nocardia sp. NPDC050710 TaxID=3157220 RepID=UPI0033D4E179
MSRADAASRRSQEERRSEAERRLLESAAELVGEIGPSKVTLAAIGDRAGYSRGLVTHHFGSKGAMMERLVGVVGERFREDLVDATASASWADLLLEFVRAYFAVVSDMPPMNRARLVLWADAVATPSELRPAITASDREFREELANRIVQGQAAGEFAPDINSAGLATVTVAMLRGVALQKMLDPDLDLDAGRVEIEHLLLTRLCSTADGEVPPG